ncbi:hypothetical protein [Longimicrobium sp.]|uniref:hypothetical protein n=1 Tax=Longimicrobium sp. TaxID=2029185 RepID=UPI003B3AF163
MRHLLSAPLTSLLLAACAAPANGPRMATIPAGPAGESRPSGHLDTETWARGGVANYRNVTEIHIRNKSRVPIVVTEVRLSTCINIMCVTHRPDVRIEPGSTRRVLQLRSGAGLATSSFRYSYRVEPASAERS